MPAKAKEEKASYLVQDELCEISYILGQLDEIKSCTSAVSLGDIPLFDVNGEPLGTLTWADGGWRFRP